MGFFYFIMNKSQLRIFLKTRNKKEILKENLWENPLMLVIITIFINYPKHNQSKNKKVELCQVQKIMYNEEKY